MSRLWACDRCGITAPYEAGKALPDGWKQVMTRALPDAWRDICPPCLHDLDQTLRDWFANGNAASDVVKGPWQEPPVTPSPWPPGSVACADMGKPPKPRA
jgi:hypothetical protein